MNETLIKQLSIDDKVAFNKLKHNLKVGILNYDFNDINELRNCIHKGFYPNKMATYVYQQYQYSIVNCKSINAIKNDIDKCMREMILLAKNKIELSYTKKNEYGPNALKNCVTKNRHLSDNEKTILYKYIDDVSAN
jgi:hypothetical protein